MLDGDLAAHAVRAESVDGHDLVGCRRKHLPLDVHHGEFAEKPVVGQRRKGEIPDHRYRPEAKAIARTEPAATVLVSCPGGEHVGRNRTIRKTNGVDGNNSIIAPHAVHRDGDVNAGHVPDIDPAAVEMLDGVGADLQIKLHALLQYRNNAWAADAILARTNDPKLRVEEGHRPIDVLHGVGLKPITRSRVDKLESAVDRLLDHDWAHAGREAALLKSRLR